MVGGVRGAMDRQADSPGNPWGGHRAEVLSIDQYRLNAMDVSRGTLIVGGTSAIVGAGVGAAIAGLVTADRPGPTLWHRADRSGAPPVNGLHLQYGSDAASEVVCSCTPQPR